MSTNEFVILPAPKALQDDVECFRIAHYTGEEGLSVTVSVSGFPGIVFQHNNGRSPIKSITTPTRRKAPVPTLYIYGQITEPSVMNHCKGPYTMTQVILKPHALKTLLGMDASALTDGSAEFDEFSAQHFNDQLLEASSDQERMSLITDFLLAKRAQTDKRDALVEESLRLIHKNIGSIHVRYLLEQLSISERQFERRFKQSVGVSPQFYIRVKRFNRAVMLMKAGKFRRFTDIAHELNFYDEAHFVRDIKAFSGITPKSLAQREDDFHHAQAAYSYV